jgi:hypothetical protein
MRGLEPWEIGELWLMGGPSPNRYVDISDVFARKLAALRAHALCQAALPRFASGANRHHAARR